MPFDAGASLTHQASSRVEREEQLDSASTYNFEYFGKLLRRRLNESIHKECTCNAL
jgi:hypothetical protein